MPDREVSRQSLTVRYLTLFGGEAFSKVCVLLAFAYLARVLGPHDFGLIELALSITLFFALATECGLGSYGARLVAAGPGRTPQLVARIILVRLTLGVLAYSAILFLSAHYGLPGIGLLAIYGLTVLFAPLYVQWVFQGLGRMRWVALGSAVRYFVFAAIVLLFVRPGSDLRLIAVAEILGIAALVTFNLIGLFWRLRIQIDWHGAVSGARRVLAEAWSLGASEVTWAALWYSPTIILGYFAEAEDVAWLAGPLRIVLALHTFVWLYFFNLLPGLSRAFVTGVDSWRSLANRSLGTSMWLACLLAGGVTLVAPVVVTTLYGPAYAEAALPLQIVIWMIPVAWASGHFRYSLIATGNQRWEFYAAAITAAATVSLAILLVRGGGGSAGAALALLMGGVLNALLTAAAMERRIGPLNVGRAIRLPAGVCLACVGVGFVITEVAGHVTGAALAFAGYAAIASQRDSELVRLRQFWLGR